MIKDLPCYSFVIECVKKRYCSPIRFENLKILVREVHIIVPVERWDRNGTPVGSLFFSLLLGLDKVFVTASLSLWFRRT